MRRLLSAVAGLLFAGFTMAGCCSSLCGVATLPCDACGLLCRTIPTGLLLPLVVQAPADNDTALVSSQIPTYDASQSTCTADNPMPF